MIVVGVLTLAAVGIWWWTRTVHVDAVSTRDHPTPALAAVPTTTPSAPAAATDTPSITTGARDRAGKPVAEARDPAPAHLAAPVIGVGVGARPLSAEGERRLAEFLAGLRTSSSNVGDFELLGRSEPADPDWSPRLEAMIQQVIDRRGHEFSQLEIGRPRCSKSLCMLTAVATTRNPQHLPQADFQRLVYTYMVAEPWFRDSFFDASTTVAADTTGSVFVTYFIRR